MPLAGSLQRLLDRARSSAGSFRFTGTAIGEKSAFASVAGELSKWSGILTRVFDVTGATSGTLYFSKTLTKNLQAFRSEAGTFGMTGTLTRRLELKRTITVSYHPWAQGAWGTDSYKQALYYGAEI